MTENVGPENRNESRRRRISVCAILGLFLLALGTGCQATRMRNEVLPEEPIAFLYWEDKAASKRSDVFGKANEIPRPPADPDNRARQEELEIRTHLRAEISPVLRSMLAKHPGHMMLYWPRTEEVERIEAAPADALPLAWSRDHKRLLFASSHRGGKEQLYEYHLDRKDLSVLTVGPEEHPRGSYDAAGNLVIERLVRETRNEAALQTLHQASPSGRLEKAFTAGVPPGTVRVSPDGDRVVFEQVNPRPRRDGPTVYESLIAAVDVSPGASPEVLLKGREPVWTPDGRWIVFASPSSAGYRLRRMRPDGTSRVPISPGGTEERMPAVSPDGEYVAYVQFVNGKRRLAVRRFDGKGNRLLLSKGWAEFPVW
ncbi:MAG: TolB family protein [Myxococcota bacterium]